MKLRGKQKRFLRAQANEIKPVFSIGKNGLSDVWLNEVVEVLNNRELIKVNIQQASDITVDEAKNFIEENSNVQVVQTIGRTLLLFVVSKKENKRKISIDVSEI